MAKNIKLKIKNEQIAGVLNLSKKLSTPKTTASKKKKPVKKAAEETSSAPKRKARILPPIEAEKPKEEGKATVKKAAHKKETAVKSDINKEEALLEPIIEQEKVIEEAPATKVEEEKPIEELVKKEEALKETAKTETQPPAKEEIEDEKTKELRKEKEKVKLEKAIKEIEASREGFKTFKDYKAGKRFDDKGKFNTRDRLGLSESEEGRWRKKRPRFKKQIIETPIIRPKSLKVKIPITVKDLAAAMKLKASELISKLFMQGIVLTLNDYLEDETTIQLLGQEFDCELSIDTEEEKRLQITTQSIQEEIKGTSVETLLTRPPVITFMGHVDHGKTSLIDAIRLSNIVSGEAGAITQHIGAFTAKTKFGNITILDTPGHEAFTEMRLRGATVTDIVVLVIAGDEGIRDQTIEALHQAKNANVPIVVAINKCDKAGYDQEKIFRQLADNDLLPEAWGGTVITVRCSAVTKEGMPELLEMLSLQAEILEIKADPASRARGTVLESEMHKGLGAAATVLVQNGTLKLGDPIVFGSEYGKIKTMHDQYGKNVETAGPSIPVKITGLSNLAEAGSEFIVVANEKEARDLAKAREEGEIRTALKKSKRAGIDMLKQKEEKKVLAIILRADVQGSLEALKLSLEKIDSDKVDLNIVSSEVGEISESDVRLAYASKAAILGFHTHIESNSEPLIKHLKVTVKLHDIIYHAIDDIKELMRKTLDKISEEHNTGEAKVIALFKSSQLGIIAGCMITDGIIKRSSNIRLIRKGEVIHKGKVASLKRVKEDVKEVQKGIECGILLENFTTYEIDDIIQAFDVTYLEQQL